MYTNDCRSVEDGCYVIKYADDTVIIGNISDDDEEKYFHQVECFVRWCQDNFLNLNVRKTKEMYIDYRKVRNYGKLSIMCEDVAVVDSYKYLGVHIDNQLNFSGNVHHVYKKAVQRLHFLRVLSNVGVDQHILTLFYRSVIESILMFGMTAWFGLITKKDKAKLNKIVKKSFRMGVKAQHLDALYNERLMKCVDKVIKDSKHPLHCEFQFLKSGLRLRSVAHRTSRLGKSMVPSGVRVYNHNMGKR